MANLIRDARKKDLDSTSQVLSKGDGLHKVKDSVKEKRIKSRSEIRKNRTIHSILKMVFACRLFWRGTFCRGINDIWF
ncbi:hypothetical protein [Leptospira paudalimensis]|uniref:Uncharacterized protein n=1 Tax=Leptospira paudalimensis TaxID=2950024 RepID=A0ABT3M3V0_9LEPT|nr:hypothetical protein [Leptospira paudalimensis]MCW7503069.1 hypothetical protein [Leptospira paudalimensis]